MPAVSEKKIAFLGFGNMASAMADGWIKAGVKPENMGACAAHYDALCERTHARGMRAFDGAAEAVAWADVVIVAVKPYLVEKVLTPLKDQLCGKVVISVAVGILNDRFNDMLGADIAHLSTLPNTPAGINEGIVIAEAANTLSDEQKALAEGLLGMLGLCVFVGTETMGAAGILSGCGPAFAAMFIEALADGAVKHGVPRKLAYALASQMLAGTAKLQLATGAHPGAMKDAVCSPGGTTIRGVSALEDKGFRGAVIGAFDAIVNK